MNQNQTSIIVNSLSPLKPEATDFADNLAQNYNVVFRHQTGFIRVVDAKAQEVWENLRRKKLSRSP